MSDSRPESEPTATVAESDARRSSGRRRLLAAAPGILLALALLLPFGGKAFTIDDPQFLQQAQHALTDPLHPTAFETVWSDSPAPLRMSEIMRSGPVAAWLLIPAVANGGSEWLAHAIHFALFVLAILATVALALRLALPPSAAAASGLLLASTPAVLGMAGTVMPDIPAMALGICGLERLVAWSQDRRLHRAAAATMLLGLAPLARLHLVFLFVVGALLVATDFPFGRNWRTIRWRTWSPLAFAAAITATLFLLSRDPQGAAGGLAASAWDASHWTHVASNLVAFATHWVLVLPLALPWIVIRHRAWRRRWWLVLPVIAALGAALYTVGRASGSKVPFLFAITQIAVLGAVVLYDVFADAVARRDSLQLTLALWLLIPLPIATYMHLPSKYLVPAAPAVALLVARALGRLAPSLARTTLAIVVVLGVALGLAILRADSRFAGLARRAAAELVASNVAAGHRVWFTGVWGFSWYASVAGGEPLTTSLPGPAPGDLIAVSHRALPSWAALQAVAKRHPRMVVVDHLEDLAPSGRVMDARVGAGFFSNAWGYLPWAWGSDDLDRFDLLRIDSPSS